MEYYYEFQDWLYRTSLYQDILKELPIPLNNIHFDSVVILGVTAYAVYRVIDGICCACYRRHIRKRQERDRKLQLEREKEMLCRELQVQQKEENLGRFLEYLEKASARRRGQMKDYDNQIIQGRRQNWLGRKDYFLEENNFTEVAGRKSADISEYDSVMDAFIYDAEQDRNIKRKREAEREQVFSRMNDIDDSLRVREIVVEEESVVDYIENPDLEKRKEKARRKEEKQRRKEEKRMKKSKKGKWGWKH